MPVSGSAGLLADPGQSPGYPLGQPRRSTPGVPLPLTKMAQHRKSNYYYVCKYRSYIYKNI